MKIRKNNLVFEMTICFFMALGIRLFISLNALPVRTVSDEVASMSAAAWFAGYDWSAVIENAGYYGTGFFGLFWWIFKLTDNPIIIYRVILIGCAVVQALTAVISYYIFTVLSEKKNVFVQVVEAVLCSYCVATRTSIAYNEHPLILLIWLYVLFFILQLKYRRNHKKNGIYTLLCMSILAYGITVHIRFVIVIIATIITWGVYYLLFHEKMINIRYFIYALCSCVLAKLYINFVQKEIWLADGKIRNSTIKITTNANLLSPVTWKAWFDIIIGQLTSINVAFLGLFLFALVIATLFIIKILRCKHKSNIEEPPKVVMAVLLISIFCIFGTIFAQSISWLNGVVEGVENVYDGASWYPYKAFTYVRYAAPYIGPIVMCAILLCRMFPQIIRKALGISIVIFAIMVFYFIQEILPFIENNVNAVEAYIPWSFGWKYGDKVTNANYLLSIMLIMILYFFGFFILKVSRIYILEVIMVLLLQAQFITIAQNRDITMQQKNYRRVYETYNLIKSADIDLSDTKLYVHEMRDVTDHQIFYLYQFYLNRYTIIPGLPNDFKEKEVVITNGEVGELSMKLFYKIRITNEQYIYTNDFELYEKMKLIIYDR